MVIGFFSYDFFKICAFGKYYGSKRFWPYIAKFNQDAITNPDNIPIGTVIKIPAIVPKEWNK